MYEAAYHVINGITMAVINTPDIKTEALTKLAWAAHHLLDVLHARIENLKAGVR